MSDAGTPRPSWTARMENSGSRPNNARSIVSRKFLGLEIKGNSKTKAIQSLVLAPKVHLTGLNEIRLSPHSSLTINGGTVVTRRWGDVSPNATLQGTGSINGTVYNGGSVMVPGGDESSLKVDGDYHQTGKATLSLKIVESEKGAITVAGTAHLAGRLAITVQNGFKPAAREAFTVLSAQKIKGTFTNPDDSVTASDGSSFSIGYSDSAVILTLK